MAGPLPFGQRGKELVQELARSDGIPAYNAQGVRQVIEEVNALYKHVNATVADSANVDDPAVACPLIVYHRSAVRNKRCLLAYLKHRTGKLAELRWQQGSTVPDEVASRLSAEEQQFFDNYDTLLGDYMRAVDLDLTSDQVPPKSLFLEVRVLKDCGEILTEGGTVRLERNTTHFLRRADVEHLIRQGMVEQISQ